MRVFVCLCRYAAVGEKRDGKPHQTAGGKENSGLETETGNYLPNEKRGVCPVGGSSLCEKEREGEKQNVIIQGHTLHLLPRAVC